VSARPGHRSDIQGLRAIAVLLVALSHAGVTVLRGGFVGVDVFFVLSGFLITGLLLAEARRRRFVSLADFYLRRARRILPAAVLTLVVTDYAAYHLLNLVRAKQYLQDSIPSLFFSANIHFAAIGTDYFAQGQPPSPFQHFWSLAVEEQFYVVWPTLFILFLGLSFRRFGPRPRELRERAIRRVLAVVVAVGTLSLLWSVLDTSRNQAAAYFSTPARVWELALGAGLALSASRLRRMPTRAIAPLGWLGVALVAVAAVAFSAATPFPGYAALLPTVGAALIIVAGIPEGRASRFTAGGMLAHRVLIYIGDRSYAFYLWHWPVLVIVAQHTGHPLSVGTNLLLLAGAFALSTVSYRFYEKPLRFAALTGRPSAALGWVSMVVVVLALATTWISAIDNRETVQSQAAALVSVPVLATASPSATTNPTARGGSADIVAQSIPAVAQELARDGHRAMPATLVPAVGDLLKDLPSVAAGCIAYAASDTHSPICRLGATSSRRLIVIIGDSHAEVWTPDVIGIGLREGWTVVPLLKAACTPQLWVDGGNVPCRSWFRWALGEARALHPAVAILTGRYSGFDDRSSTADLDGLDAAVRGLKRVARQVVLIGDVPERATQPVDCLLAPHATPASCIDSWTDTEAQLTSQAGQLAVQEHAAFIDTTGWFCYRTRCPLVIGNLIAYRDGNHVSQTYVAALSGAFRSAFDQAIRRR
jgi:peptidoglycan/LPS O-acetylase OafA/YrhL